MTATLLLVIVAIGAWSMRGGRGMPGNLASWAIVALTLYGIVTSADLQGRLLFAGAMILGPILPHIVRVLWGLTLRPIIHYLTFDSPPSRAIFAVSPEDALYATAGEQIDPLIATLVSSGFTSAGRIGMKLQAQTAVAETFVRGNGEEWVHVTAVIPKGAQPVVMHCTFTFEDGHMLTVTNLPWVDLNPPTRNV